jgi:heme exporter protein D
MSYREYVIAAYAVFVIVLLWDLLAPHLQIRQQLRAAKLRIARTTQSAAPPAELPLSRD